MNLRRAKARQVMGPALPSLQAEEIEEEREEVDDVDSQIDNWVDWGQDELEEQQLLHVIFLSSPKDAPDDPISETIHRLMYALCFRAETVQEQNLMNKTQRGRVAEVLRQLRDAKCDLSQIHIFEAWWITNWRSKAKGTGHYQPPTPERVLEHWSEAMRSGVKPAPIIDEPRPNTNHVDVTSIMRARALHGK